MANCLAIGCNSDEEVTSLWFCWKHTRMIPENIRREMQLFTPTKKQMANPDWQSNPQSDMWFQTVRDAQRWIQNLEAGGNK